MNRFEIIEEFKEYQKTKGNDGNCDATISEHVFTANKVFDLLGDDFSKWNNLSLLKLKTGLKKYTDRNGIKKTYATTTFNKNLMSFKILLGFLLFAQQDLNIDLSKIDKDVIFKEFASVKIPDSEKKEVGAKPIDYKKFESFIQYVLTNGKGKNTVRARVIVLLEVTCGIRRTEVHMLKRDDVSFDDNMLYLKDTKFDKHRNVPIQQFVLDEISRLYEMFPNSEYVITTNEGKSVAISQINRSVKTVATKAVQKGIIDEVVSNHSLRKTYSGYLHFEKGVSGKVIQELLGHASFKTTEENYLKTNKKDIKDEILDIDMLGVGND